MSLKSKIITTFREIFITGHSRSVKFRAKLFAAMILARKKIVKEDYDEVEKIATEIYENDPKKAKLLLAFTKEYVTKANVYKSLNLDSLLKEIDQTLKNQKYFAKKIDFSHLRRLFSQDNDDALLQQRIYEFLISEFKRYGEKE